MLSASNQDANLSSSEWVEYTSDDGIKYWHNTRTQQSSWEDPNQATKKSGSAIWEWEMYKTETGEQYWYNKTNNSTTWEDPTKEWKPMYSASGEVTHYYNTKTGESRYLYV